MVKVFGQTDTSFLTNGDIVLKPLKAKVHKEDNGLFYLDLDVGLEYIDYMVEGNIVVAPTPQGEQGFRIGNVIKTNKKLSTRAYHLFYDTKNYLISNSFAVERDCSYALDHFNSSTEPQSPFTTVSDVTTVNTYRCVRKSLYEAVFTVLERWGGHLVRDNFTIAIRSNIGQDNGVVVRYKKNLKSITCEENWDNVVTKLMPVGWDGLLLPEVYLVSETQYALPYTKTVHFNQNISQSDYMDNDGNYDEQAYQQALVDDLRNQAQLYLDENCIPKVNYTLKANLERITDIGDVVEVVDERLGVNLMTNVIVYDYDCILGMYTSVEFGNFTKKLSGLIGDITASTEEAIASSVETVEVTLGKELQNATDKIWGALGNSYVIYDGDKILVVDELPKENAHNVMMINSGGIGFSQNGINGPFNSAWAIDGTMDMQSINVINLTANLIKGGTLKLGSERNVSGVLELYDGVNNLVGLMDKDGLKMYGQDGSYVMMNNDVGFAGYDRNDNKIYWVSQDEFHQKKSVVEEEITLCGKMRFIPITIYDQNNNMVNDGIGLVSSVT